MWVRNLMHCSSTVPKDLLYLELSILPIRYIIQTRRLLYLHHILQNKRESLLRRFYEAQLLNPTHRDWATQVLEDLEELGIDLELEQIEEMKRDFFKSIVKDAVQKKAFESLINRKNSRTSENAKGKLIIYEDFRMAEYLSPNTEQISIEERKWIFRCRVDDIDIKGNRRWQYEDISCSSCKMNIEETQFHLLN